LEWKDVSCELFVLGGSQTDFARNYEREGSGIFEMFRDVIADAFASTAIDPRDVEVAHIGNFAGELFTKQGQLGGFLGHVHPDLIGIPSSRHEAACASGSVALLAGGADIESRRYDLALVVGIELMRNVDGIKAAEYLGSAAWIGMEGQNARYLWPFMFSKLATEYEERYGLDHAHLRQISKNAFANAKRNPNSQTRNWRLTSDHFSDHDEFNPLIEGCLRKSDCGQVTDGAAAIFIASHEAAKRYAAKRGIPIETIPRIKGWGHSTAPLLYSKKIEASRKQEYVFPQTRRAMMDVSLPLITEPYVI